MSTGPEVLSSRELDVVRGIARGLKYHEIAEMLDLSFETVKTYASRIRRKLSMRSKIQIALWAVHHRIEETNGRTGTHS